jgi:hypothetical protein
MDGKMINVGKFDDMLARNKTASWLYARAQTALIEAAATAKPLTKEELDADPFGYQIAEIDKVCLLLLLLLYFTS